MKIDLTPAQRSPTAQARGHIHRLLHLLPNPDAHRDPLDLFDEALAQVTREVEMLLRDGAVAREDALKVRARLLDLLQWADRLDVQAARLLAITREAGRARVRTTSPPSPKKASPAARARHWVRATWFAAVLRVRFAVWKGRMRMGRR